MDAPGDPILRTASNQLIQYYISLPAGWSKNRQWPVVIAVEAAEKRFRENALRFIAARNNLPFIIISPIIVSNGNYGRRDPSVYPYSSETWDKIDAMTDCRFDMEGLIQILKDVKAEYNGEDKVYLTGFEAGAHLVWAMLFAHPDILKGVAPVAGNYNGRCVDAISNPSAVGNPPVSVFIGELDKECRAGGRFYGQLENARKAAKDRGIREVPEVLVPGKGHLPLPDEVLTWFWTLAKSDIPSAQTVAKQLIQRSIAAMGEKVWDKVIRLRAGPSKIGFHIGTNGRRPEKISSFYVAKLATIVFQLLWVNSGPASWLHNFAYRIHINPLVFIYAAALALLIALMTVSFQAVRAARTSPVKSLRSD